MMKVLTRHKKATRSDLVAFSIPFWEGGLNLRLTTN